MATTRIAFGAVLSTVNDAAQSVSAIFGTVTEGIGMANTFVKNAAEQQRLRAVVDMDNFGERLTEEKAMEEALRKKQVEEFTNASKDNERLYSTAYDRIAALVAASKK